jgi:geranylgeranyl reductase family protein
MHTYDVVVVGAGPAGAFLAYLLASRGASVALLEKEQLPRYKVCGGGVTKKARQLLDFDISSTFERTPHVGVVTLRQQKTLKVALTEPIAWTVMRDRFDSALVDMAVKRGVKLFEGRQVQSVEGRSVRVNGEVFHGEVIAGADGVLSRVAHTAGLRTGRQVAAAVECEVEVPAAILERYADSAVFDFGSSPYGYGWIFPKREHLSIGVCTILSKSSALVAHMDRLLQAYCADGHLLRRRGHLLPLFIGPEPLVRDRVVLLGDAAGIVDPFTGEGVYYALKSASLAADSIGAFLGGKVANLDGYNVAVWDTIGPEFMLAKRVSKVLYSHMELLYDLCLRNRFFATGFIGVLTGETTYARFISSSLRSPLKILTGYLRR